MAIDLPVRCFCGSFEGVVKDVSPAAGTHLVCYCDDCQTFQHVLGQADRVLDANGGTEVFQMSPARLSVTRGMEHLACLRLGPKGTVRWYASCCNTPIGNTLDKPALPFVGMVTACFDRSAGTDSVDAALGPLKKGVFGKYAVGDTDDLYAYDSVPIAPIGSFIVRLIRWRLRGDHKRSPFFVPDTGEIVAQPRLVSKEERDAARAKIGA